MPLREHFDYIIVDTPPIGVVIDAAIIAQRCDGTVLITESGANGRKASKGQGPIRTNRHTFLRSSAQ